MDVPGGLLHARRCPGMLTAPYTSFCPVPVPLPQEEKTVTMQVAGWSGRSVACAHSGARGGDWCSVWFFLWRFPDWISSAMDTGVLASSCALGSEPLGAQGAKLFVEGSGPCFHVSVAGDSLHPIPYCIYTLIPSPSFAFSVFVQVGVKNVCGFC